MAPKVRKSIGKAQAREQFSTLVESVSKGAGAVEITDYGKIAAVLISEKEYTWLRACADRGSKNTRDPRGYLILSDDFDLEKESRELSSNFEKSIKKTAKGL